MKRFLDVLISSLIIIICIPLIAVILLIVYIVTDDSPLLTQERKIHLSKSGIKIIKIRTIKNSKSFNELKKKSVKVFNKEEYEDYVPSFCRYLRKTGIDELPQIINVLRGEMSLVGPRPLNVQDLQIMKRNQPQHYERRNRVCSKPGITGYWQVYGKRDLGEENLLAEDEYYEQNKSLSLDLKIMIKTFLVIITARHSDSIVRSITKANKGNARVAKLIVFDGNKSSLDSYRLF